MGEQSNESDTTEFQVYFLGKFHDIWIDWNDDNEFKQQQIFEQLEDITGITRFYSSLITFHQTRIDDPDLWPGEHRFINIYNNIIFDDESECEDYLKKEEIYEKCIEDGERFYLNFTLDFEPRCIDRLAIDYELVPEVEVIEGRCTPFLCQTAISKPFFNRMKSLVLNDPLNDAIADRIDKLIRDDRSSYARGKRRIFKDFNILPVSEVICSFQVMARNIDARFDRPTNY